MSNLVDLNPYGVYNDLQGRPLNNGKVYIGLPNQDPKGYPAQVYWDAAMTIPAAQPLRTVGGYVARNGTPARVYVNGNYSLQVTTSTDVQVFYVQDYYLVGSAQVVTAPQLTPVFDSIAALRANANPNIISKACSVTSYYGGSAVALQQPPFQGNYFIKTSDTTSSDNGGTIIVDAIGNRWYLSKNIALTFHTFGAKGDNSNNDTSACNNALAFAGTVGACVYALEGTYYTTATINLPRTASLIGLSRSYPVAAYNPTQRITGAVIYKAHSGVGLSCVGSGAYSECGEISNITVMSNYTTWNSGSGISVDKVGTFKISDCTVWSCGGNGFEIGTTQNTDVTGQISLYNLYVNNCLGYSFYNRSKWLRAYNIQSDGGTWGLWCQDASEALIDGFHFEGFSVGGIRMAGASPYNLFKKGFLGLTNAASLYGVYAESVAGNVVNEFENIHLVGRSGAGVIAYQILSSAQRTKITSGCIYAFPIGINDNSVNTVIQSGLVIDSCALPIAENGNNSQIRGIVTIGTTGGWSIDHQNGGGGIWEGNILDTPIKPTLYGGTNGNFGTNIVKNNQGYKTSASGQTGVVSSGATIPHGMSSTPYTAQISALNPFSQPADLKIGLDATNITLTWSGGTSAQLTWSAKCLCEQ